VFGRRRREAEALREAERKALFEQLAKRPETVCPFLGLASARAEYRDGVSGEHRCFAFGDPAPISDEQQRHVCLERGYSNCPRYLRGVLVIPSEELEALRRPQPMRQPPPRPSAPPVRVATDRGGGGRWRLVALLALLLIAAGAAGGWYVILRNGGVSTLPSPTPGTPLPTVPPSGTGTPPVGSPIATATIEPTPAPGDRFDHYEVVVSDGTYTLYLVDPQAGITQSRVAQFGRISRAPVEPHRTTDGLVYWETTTGYYVGWSYIPGQSGPFQLREVFLTPQGERRVQAIEPAEETVLPVATPSPRT
jgi:hypothetical protein